MTGKVKIQEQSKNRGKKNLRSSGFFYLKKEEKKTFVPQVFLFKKRGEERSKTVPVQPETNRRDQDVHSPIWMCI